MGLSLRWPRALSRELSTEVVIDAAQVRVWQALVDLESYSRWNRFIPKAQGKIAMDAVLKIILHPPGSGPQQYKVRVVSLDEGSQFDWLGYFWLPGLIDGHHVLSLQQVMPDRTRLIHREKFSGLLVPFVWNSFLNSKLRAGFVSMNQDLKHFVEGNHDATETIF